MKFGKRKKKHTSQTTKAYQQIIQVDIAKLLENIYDNYVVAVENFTRAKDHLHKFAVYLKDSNEHEWYKIDEAIEKLLELEQAFIETSTSVPSIGAIVTQMLEGEMGEEEPLLVSKK